MHLLLKPVFLVTQHLMKAAAITVDGHDIFVLSQVFFIT
jgi:hypothetical protein